MSDFVEKLKFKIGLSGTFHNKKPAFTVSLNGQQHAQDTVRTESDEIFYVEFETELADAEVNILQIRLTNKSSQDTVVEDGQIVKDMLLNIKSIEIDNVDLGSLIWSHSKFHIDNPQKFNGNVVTSLENCVNLGWNGTYQFEFNTPFYIWLLENI
jgi:hypothetical protein